MSRIEAVICDICGARMEQEHAKLILPAEPQQIKPSRYPPLPGGGRSAVPFVVDARYIDDASTYQLAARFYDICADCTAGLKMYIADNLKAARERLTEGQQREFAQRMPGVYRNLRGDQDR